LKQTETPFGVSDTFPAYKIFLGFLFTEGKKVLLVKVFFFKKKKF